jgi:hypothetical protein
MGCGCDWGHVQGWIESEDRSLGRVLRLHGRAVRSEKKGGVASLSNKFMAGSVAGGVHKTMEGGRIVENSGVERQIPVGSGG